MWNSYVNLEIYHHVAPPFVFFGCTISVLANYATIKMFGTFPFMVYLTFPIVGVIEITVLGTILPRSAISYEESARYLRALRELCFRRYERRLIRSLRPIGLRVGHFGTITTIWMVAIIKTIVDCTINLLLTY